jgi:ubiquitin-conjugating enzyme E2 H
MDRQQSTSSNGSFGTPVGNRRRQGDFVRLATSGKYTVTPTETVGDFYVHFEGPKDTPYEGGHWQIHVLLPDAYPLKSPSIGFANPIFHPNVEERSGSVCLDVINQTWTPMYDLINVFDIFLPQLLRYPNSADPLNAAAATMQLESLTKYGQYIRAHIAQHATYERAMRVVAHLRDPDEVTPDKQPALPEVSPATTFTSRGLSDSPPSSLGDGDVGQPSLGDDDEDDEVPAEIDI